MNWIQGAFQRKQCHILIWKWRKHDLKKCYVYWYGFQWPVVINMLLHKIRKVRSGSGGWLIQTMFCNDLFFIKQSEISSKILAKLQLDMLTIDQCYKIIIKNAAEIAAQDLTNICIKLMIAQWKKQWKAVQCYEKPVKNYCMFDISCLNDSDRLKSAVMFCFYKPFTVINSTLLVLYSTLYSTWLFELTSKLNGFVLV